jgi:hypothetical protein
MREISYVRDPRFVSGRTFSLADAQVPHRCLGTEERCAAVSHGGRCRPHDRAAPGPWTREHRAYPIDATDVARPPETRCVYEIQIHRDPLFVIGEGVLLLSRGTESLQTFRRRGTASNPRSRARSAMVSRLRLGASVTILVEPKGPAPLREGTGSSNPACRGSLDAERSIASSYWAMSPPRTAFSSKELGTHFDAMADG